MHSIVRMQVPASLSSPPPVAASGPGSGSLSPTVMAGSSGPADSFQARLGLAQRNSDSNASAPTQTTPHPPEGTNTKAASTTNTDGKPAPKSSGSSAHSHSPEKSAADAASGSDSGSDAGSGPASVGAPDPAIASAEHGQSCRLPHPSVTTLDASPPVRYAAALLPKSRHGYVGAGHAVCTAPHAVGRPTTMLTALDSDAKAQEDADATASGATDSTAALTAAKTASSGKSGEIAPTPLPRPSVVRSKGSTCGTAAGDPGHCFRTRDKPLSTC